MSREKQIEEMANDLAQHCPDLVENCCGASSCVSCLVRFLHNAGYRKQSEGIANNATTAGEWISVDERVPEPFVSVLVYMPDEIPHPTVREGFINKRGEWYAGGFDRLPDEVVSWMKMPEAPKMKGGERE